MKKFFTAFLLIFSVIFSFGRQASTTGVYEEKKDSLKAAGVVAQRTLVKLQADKLTYDVEHDPDSQSMTVLQMLRKVPMVTVGADDKITVNGSSSFKVYVDGRPDRMLSTDPSRLFKMMPASNIKRIEVVTNPGAKYDAEGVGGVLELKTTSGSGRAPADGIYGTTTAEATTLGGIYGSASLNARLGKWTVGTNIAPAHSRNIGIETVTTRQAATYSSKETRIEDIVNNSCMGSLSASYEADSLNLVTASFGLNDSPNHGRMYDSRFSATSGAAELYSYDMHANYHESWGYVAGSLDWQHRFKTNTERTLTLSWQISDSPARTRDTTFISNIHGLLPFESDDVLLIKNNKSLENTFQGDFATSTGTNQTFIAGAKLIFRRFQTDATDGVTPIRYGYRSRIGASYAEYRGSFGRFTLKGGVRYEHTWQDYNQTGQSFSLDYGNLVPNAGIQYDLGPRSNLCLSYNLRISRPGISYLSPYIDRLTPNSISRGNPELKAENGHRIDLVYNMSSPKWVVNVILGERFSNNGISDYTILNGDISEKTYGNILKRNAVGANVYVNWNPGGKTRLYLSADGGYLTFRSDRLDQRNSGLGVSAMLGVQQVLPGDLRLSSNFSVKTRNHSLQGWRHSPAYLSLYLAKSFLDDRLTVSLSAITNFRKGKMEMTSRTEGTAFTTCQVTRMSWRYAGSSISYTFGKKRIAVKRTSRSIVNDDLVGGSQAPSSRSRE